MKKTSVTAMAIGILFLLTGYASVTQIAEAQEKEHAGYVPNVRSAGDHYVMMFIDRKTIRIGVQILDRYGEPCALDEESIKSEIIRENGQKETVLLMGEGYEVYYDEGNEFVDGATLYTKRFRWLNQARSVALKAWVPLPDGKIYEPSFKCNQLSLPPHSGIGRNSST